MRSKTDLRPLIDELYARIGKKSGGTTVSVLGTGVWISVNGVLQPSASLGAPDTLLVTNHAGTATVWIAPGQDLTYASGLFTVVGLQTHPLPIPSGVNTNLSWTGSALTWAAAAPTTGRYLGTTEITVSGTFTTQPATTRVVVRGIGGGGAGGGATNGSAGQSSVGGGGGEGAYTESSQAVTGSTGYPVTVGNGGGGVLGGSGNPGSASTFTLPTPLSVPGGGGGLASGSVPTANFGQPGAGAAVSTGGLVNSGGSPGAPGVVLVGSTGLAQGGDGAPSPLGGAGLGTVSPGPGGAATGFGAGGGGAMSSTSPGNQPGGSGSNGVWIVDEYS